MSPLVRLRVLWERYVAPTRAERDPGFRAVLDGATVLGLKVAGTFGVLALLGALLASVVTAVLGGGTVVGSVMESSEQIWQTLSDKLYVYASAAAFLVVARFRPGVGVGRLTLAAYVLVGAAVIATRRPGV